MLISYIKSHWPLLFDLLLKVHSKLFPIRGKYNTITNNGRLIHSKISIRGDNNRIFIASGCILCNVEFHIRGSNHIIEIGTDCKIYEWGSLWCEGEGNKIIIGDGSTIRSAHLCAQETDTSIIIGKNCLLSNNIEIRTSDSHPYYDCQTGKRLNLPASVYIGDHVWICAKAAILKGAHVGNGSIVGYGSVLSSNIPDNTIAVGKPAKVVRENIYWNHCFSGKHH